MIRKKLVKQAAGCLLASAMVMTNSYMGINMGGRAENVAYAEESTYTVGNSTYTYQVMDDGTIEITGYEGTDTEIFIPAEIDGKSVTGIGDWIFSECSSLTSVEIPNSVTSIGNWIFWGCSSLTSVKIPNSVTSIEDAAFSGCSNLEEIKVEEENKEYKSLDGVLFNKDMTKIIKYPEGKIDTFYIIPNSVTYIGNIAFDECARLTSVKIPNSVTIIEDDAFSGCSSLEEIKVEEVNSEYKSLDGVLFNKDMTKIIKYPEGKKDAFYTIPNSVTYIGDNAFFRCSGLTSVEIPNSVTDISVYAFEWCENLTIYGEKGSYAEEFANKNNIPFNDVNEVKNGWIKENSVWYYYIDNVKSTGWQKVSGKWYYFDETGVMQTGWIKLSGKWYYLNPNGDMATGWIKQGDKWYYMESSGTMQTGWKQLGDTWYYLDPASGVMAANRWVGDYYLKPSGAMAVSEWVDGGRYYVGADGKWINGYVAQ